ncbi:unnamed protein product [Trichobilharzia szidati]|nr:unnamed protein product [Trichobilharzia szidati]
MVSLSTTIPLGPQIDIWALGCLLYCLCFFNLPFGDSVLAIQSGNFSLPDSSPYSERLHKLIGYILCVDAFKRPDIFQVCALAFSLANRSNPAQNLNNLPIPLWKDLTVPPRESQLKSTSNLLMSSELKSANRSLSPSSSASSSSSRNKSSPDQKQSTASVVDHSHRYQQQQTNQYITNTSVAPRERPRPNCSSHHPLPPPPQPPPPPPPSSFPHAPVSPPTVNHPIIVKPPTCLPVSNNNNHTSSTAVVANFTDLPDSSAMNPTSTNARFHEAFSPPSTNLNWPVEFSNNHFNSQSNEMPIKWDAAAVAAAASGVGSHQRTQSSGFVQANQTANSSDTMNPYSYGQETSLSGGGHRRCPSDTSSLLKSFPSTIRHAQSLASLNQTSKSFDSIACSNSSVKPTDVGSILPSVKQIETSISSNVVTHKLNQSMSVDASTTIGGKFNLSHASNSSPIPFSPSSSSCSTYNTPTQNVYPNEMIRMMAFTGNDSTTVNINAVPAAADDDDDVLFGVAFDAIRGGGAGGAGVASANSTSRL